MRSSAGGAALGMKLARRIKTSGPELGQYCGPFPVRQPAGLQTLLKTQRGSPLECSARSPILRIAGALYDWKLFACLFFL
jgi:hypothetical protein